MTLIHEARGKRLNRNLIKESKKTKEKKTDLNRIESRVDPRELLNILFPKWMS